MHRYLEILHKSPFFYQMSDEEILSIIQCVGGRIIHKNQHQLIFQAGQTSQEMGIVLNGTLLIQQIDLWGHSNIIAKVMQGDSFGESYCLGQAPLNVSVVVEKDCDILMLDISKILTSCPQTCHHHTKLIHNLMQVMSSKLTTLNLKITHMSKRTTREKLLSYLSSEALKHQSLTFTIPFNRQQLADYLCVERTAMSTEISKLVAEGLIETKRNEFTIKKI